MLDSKSCSNFTASAVLDVDGDGDIEILAATSGNLSLLDHTGTRLWQISTSNSSGVIAITDLDRDGSPEAVLPSFRSQVVAFSARTGARIPAGPFFDGYDSNIGVTPLRQDGLAYLTNTANSYQSNIAAFTPELQYVWNTQAPTESATDVYFATLADLLGLGRPQVILHSAVRSFTLLDGRSGKSVMPYPSSMISSSGGIDGSRTFNSMRPAVVADLDADAHAELLVSRNSDCGTEIWAYNEWPELGCNQVLIYSSPHWTQQPTAWPTRFLRKGQLGEDLKVGNDHRWWTSYTTNTFNQQFLDTPARLLPDLSVVSKDVSSMPVMGAAGTQVLLSALVRNLGGLPASDVKVSFYDGDPKTGGKHLGDAVAVGPLAVRTGSASVSVPWRAYPEGEHVIHVVVDPDTALEDSGRENNSASFRVFVQPGTQLCDLVVDATSLTATPSTPVAGKSLGFTATVRNIGASACGASALSVYDGPRSGGILAGSAALPDLPAGGQVVVSISSLGAPGTHLYRFIADAEGVALDGDRGNNEAILQVTGSEPMLPDLVVTSLELSPNPAYYGERVTLLATVLNRGNAAPATTFRARLSQTVAAEGTVPPLPSGETVRVQASFVAPGTSLPLHLEVDPEGQVAEFQETNNVRTETLGILMPQVDLFAAIDPNSAGPETNVALSLGVSNSGPRGREVFLDAEIVGPDGEQVASLLVAHRMLVEPLAEATRNLTWNTGRHAPGLYTVRMKLSQGGRQLHSSSFGITLTEEHQASTAVVTDRGTYKPGEQVLISQRATNRSRNSPLSGASVVITVYGPPGDVLYTSTRALPVLPAGGFVDTTDLFHLSPYLGPGGYTVEARLLGADGTALDTEWTSWLLDYSAQEAITGVLTAASPFPIGPPLAARVELKIAGTLSSAEEPLEVLIVDAVSLAQQSLASVPVSLAIGETRTVTVPVPTSGLPEGTKLLVARLGGRTLDRILVTAATSVDQDPPVIQVSGVQDQLLTNQNVAPTWSVQDQSAFTVSAVLDGQAFASGTEVSSEGEHVLVVTAVDAYNQQSQQTIHFIIDKTPPALVLDGPDHEALLATNVTLAWTVTDAHPGAPATASLNAASIPSGYGVAGAGDYTWTVQVSDAAGNTASETRTFTLDFSPPDLSIGGVDWEGYYNVVVSPLISAAEDHPGTLVITLDGLPFESGAMVTEPGRHVLLVVATDAVGNASTAEIPFTLDFETPVIQVSGVTANASLHQPVSPSYTVQDDNLGGVTATLDGTPFTSGATVSGEGPHTLVVVADDLAGNTAEVTVPFTLDFHPPTIQVTGVGAGEYRGQPVTMGYSADDVSLASVTATLDGVSFTSGGTVSGEGPHTLVVTARDSAGNEARTLIPFTLDYTQPSNQVSGVAEGAVSDYFDVTYSVTDTNLDTVVAVLDGSAFTSGTRVSTLGAHTLTVTATDKAGNTQSATVHFEVVSPVPRFNFAICALRDLTISNQAMVQGPSASGPASVAAHGALRLEGQASVSGDAVSGGSTTMTTAAHVGGRVYHGGTFTRSGQATVVGGTQSVSPAPAPCECGYDLTQRLSIVKVHNDNVALAALPNSALWWKNGAIELSGGTVTLPGGRYYAKHVTLSGQGVLTVASGAHVELFIEGGVTVGTGSSLGGSPSAASSLLLVSGADATLGQSVTVTNNTDAALTLYTPRADITLANNSRLYGALVGRNVLLENSQALTLTPGPQQTPPQLTCQ